MSRVVLKDDKTMLFLPNEHGYGDNAFHVAPSTIPGGGQGLYARTPLPPYTLLMEYTGVVRPMGDHPDHTYCVDNGQGQCVDAADLRFSNKARYANDALGPGVSTRVIRGQAARRNNAVLRTSPRTGKVWMVSVAPIASGEEIFVEYGSMYWTGEDDGEDDGDVEALSDDEDLTAP